MKSLLDYDYFKEVFESCETIPKNKEEYIKRLYGFWLAGYHNKENEVINKFINFIKK